MNDVTLPGGIHVWVEAGNWLVITRNIGTPIEIDLSEDAAKQLLAFLKVCYG